MRVDLKAFFVFIFFISGASVSVALSSWTLLLFGALASCAVFFVGKKAGMTPLLSCIFFVCFLGGSFYYHLRSGDVADVSRVEGGAVIVSFPEQRIDDQRFKIRTDDRKLGPIEVITRLYPFFRYGDGIFMEGGLSRGVSGKIRAFFPDIEKTGSGHGNRMKALLFSLRETLVGGLRYSLPPSSAALAAGILFGDQSGFTPEMWEAFRETGTTHIVALSGFNIGIIALCVSGIFCLISRKTGFIASIIAIVSFVVMAGGEASAVRAAIMGVIMVLGRGVGRAASMRNIIAFAALVMVIADPGVAVFDIGFELSFAAVIGVIYLPPLIKRLLRLEDDRKFRDMCIDTFSAEMAVLPIVLFRFGTMSWYSFFVNIAVLFTVPLAMGASFIVAVMGDGMGPLSMLVSVPANIILQYELKTIDLFAGIF